MTAPERRRDASMDLINQIVRQPVDPDYARVAHGASPNRQGRRWLLALVAVLIGALFAVSAVRTTRTAPALEQERRELISRVRAAEQQQDTLRTRLGELDRETSRLRDDALGGDTDARRLQDQIGGLEPTVGTVAVRGPGILIVVDDAPGGTGEERVLDVDLQIMANGLWASGAEAIAINGHRLSSLTAIRSAGEAVTVDYRSLTRPYRVEAIGDPRTLPARFVESAAGAWWNELAQNRGMAYETRSVREMTLPADPGMVLRVARLGGG